MLWFLIFDKNSNWLLPKDCETNKDNIYFFKSDAEEHNIIENKVHWIQEKD